MIHIKQFYLFGINEGKSEWIPDLRIPEEIGKDVYDDKFTRYDKVDFRSTKEIRFLENFRKNNRPYFCGIDRYNFDIRGTTKGKPVILITITKLEDDWYLIYEYDSDIGSKYYICDDWEEVIGYLSSKNEFKV